MLASLPWARRCRIRRRFVDCLSGLAALALLAGPSLAQWPAGFSSRPIGSGWAQPTGLAFAQDGRLFVWEKAGRVWLVTHDVKAPQPSIDIAEEVGNWGDYGLLGMALDPEFLQNGYVYLGYVVDHHHLRWFGTPTYDPAASTPFRDTIGRVTR
jgi:glucose/arabinose dehydrogenase